MALSTHRKSPNRERELRERAWALAEQRLAGRIICSHCRSTVANYAERCPMEDESNCPGDIAWARAFEVALLSLREVHE